MAALNVWGHKSDARGRTTNFPMNYQMAKLIKLRHWHFAVFGSLDWRDGGSVQLPNGMNLMNINGDIAMEIKFEGEEFSRGIIYHFSNEQQWRYFVNHDIL